MITSNLIPHTDLMTVSRAAAVLVTSRLRESTGVRTIGIVPGEIVPREELVAAIEARRELGEEFEPAVIDAFVERIEQRMLERQEERDQASEEALRRKREHQKEMVLGAMGISIPLFIVAAIFTGIAGVIAVCCALAVIAVASSR